MSPILTTMTVPAPTAAVRRALRQSELYSRTARALGHRTQVAGAAVDVRRTLRVGDLLRVRPAGPWAGRLPAAVARAVHLRVVTIDPTPVLEVALGAFAGWRVGFSLAELPPADPADLLDPVDRTALTVQVSGPDRGRRTRSDRSARSVRLTRQVGRASALLGGIVTLIAREPLVVVAAAVFDGGGRVLAARRAAPSVHAGGWEFPGGKVEPGEREEQALARELAEELGVVVEVGERVGPDIDLGGPAVLRCRAAVVHSGTPTPTPGQHDELRWLAADELTEVCWLPADRDLLPAVRLLLDSGAQGRSGRDDHLGHGR